MCAEIYRLFRGLLFLHGYIADLPGPSKESNDDNAFHRVQACGVRVPQDLHNPDLEVKSV